MSSTPMNTEPVQTTLRGIAAFVAALGLLTGGSLTLASEVLIWLTDGPGIPIGVTTSAVALATIIGSLWANGYQGPKNLRERVTPWHPELGAMTPAPTEAPHGPELQQAAGDEPDGIG